MPDDGSGLEDFRGHGRWPLPIAVALVMGLFLLMSTMATVRYASAQSATSEREQAVMLARSGDFAGAIDRLRRLQAENPGDAMVAMDLAVLLFQAAQAKAAIDVFEAAAMPDPPSYALMAMARAYRDQRQWEMAARTASEGQRRFSDDPSWTVLHALVLTDMGRPTEALQLLATPEAAKAPPIELALAEAYALRQNKMPMAALRRYMDALGLDPSNRNARSEAASLLRFLGGAFGAAAIAGDDPVLKSGPEMRQMEADQAASMVRWGSEVRESNPAKRFEGTDRAIANLDRLIMQASANGQADESLLRRLRMDRLVALRDRARMEDVVAEAVALRAEAPLPPYVERAFAGALHYLRRPEEARQSYETVLASDPEDTVARYGLFYAQVEAEDFEAAYRTIDELAAKTSPWIRFRDDPGRYPNWEYAEAQLAAGLARFYGDQLGEALDRVTPLAAVAPASAGNRIATANIMNARGWPRQAEEEARIAASLDPVDPGIQTMLAGLDIQRHRLRQAQGRIERLEALYPENQNVRRAAEELSVEKSALLETDVSPSWTSGGGDNSGGQELTASARLWSPPIADNWRLFALNDYSYANPIEGFVERNRSGAGVELRLEDLTAEAFFTYSTGELEEAGGGVTLEWWANDQIQLGLGGEIFSPSTPLRGLIDGVTANEVNGHATYRWHEGREISLTGSYVDFTDGNRRSAAGIDFSQRLIDVPHFELTGRASIWGSTNKLQDVRYYSPEEDLTATAGATAEHVIWRNYDDSLVQAISLDAGVYAQKGFGSDWIGILGYEHRWRLGPRTEFHYGVQLSRRVFDAEPEEGFAAIFGLSQRF